MQNNKVLLSTKRAAYFRRPFFISGKNGKSKPEISYEQILCIFALFAPLRAIKLVFQSKEAKATLAYLFIKSF
jgi:hypothetical protein